MIFFFVVSSFSWLKIESLVLLVQKDLNFVCRHFCVVLPFKVTDNAGVTEFSLGDFLGVDHQGVGGLFISLV